MPDGGLRTTTWWCEQAWLGDPGGATEAGVAITADGDRITAVETGVDPPDGAERLAGLTIPGAANAHSHAFHRALRGRTHDDGGTFWTWRETMYELAARLDPDRYLALATATFAEMALAGFTCVGEFHYLHHPSGMDEAILAAAEAAGVRLTLLDTCYLQGGLPHFRDGSVDAWADRVSGLSPTATARIGAAVHSVRAVDPEAIAEVADWAREAEAPLHAHVSEQPAENEHCVEAHGVTPTVLLAEHGALDGRFTAVHATHLSGEDLELLTGAGVCLCPTTERDLADGIGPAGALHHVGVPLCLGTDAHALIDPFEEARAVELDQRLLSRRRGTFAPGELLGMLTAEGYRRLGWPEGGRIEIGALADLTTVGLDSVRLAGTPTEGLVFAATASDVHHVVVGGRTVVRDGHHLLVDVTRALEQSIEAVWS